MYRHDPAACNRELRWITQENYWRAMRHGRRGEFVGLHEQQPVTAEGWLAQLLEQVPIDTVDAERAFQHAQRLLRDGTHADQQLRCLAEASAAGLGKAQALRAVVAAGACN